MSRRFDGSVAWITGGGTGIGKAMAVELAREGARVAVSGRRKDRLADAATAIEAAGSEGLAVACDVTDEADIERAVAEVVEHFGRLDVVVANAGFGVMGRIEDLSAEDWRRQLETNVVGLAITAKQSLPELRKTGGRLALMGSVSAYVNAPGAGAYQASKHAVRAIGETLSIELKGSGVSCTTIHPGFVESEIAKVDNEGRYHPEAKDKRPAKLMWTAEDAASTCVTAIYKRRREHVFTGHGKLGVAIARHTPGLLHAVMKPPQPKNK